MFGDTTTRRRFVTAIGLGGLAVAGSGVVAGGHNRTFRAQLAGENENPPVKTDARGHAVFNLNRDETELKFQLVVQRIEDVVAAHIHCGEEGVNGPVGVTLFEGGPTSKSGMLAKGTITAPDSGNGCGWTDLGEVVDDIRTGDTYVNVHTLAHTGGEIRGQIH